MRRTPNCLAKLDRMNKTLRHEEADRVPISDFFWGSFLERWRKDLGLPAGTDIYKYYDLDWIVTVPNMDPHIKPFEILEETGGHVIVRTGFEAVIKKQFADPMPAFLKFETDSLEKMAALRFDDPWDDRRYLSRGDNQIAGEGDGFVQNSPAWLETVKLLYPDFPVYGSVCEGQEMLWRIIGSENVMLWIGLYPDEVGVDAYNPLEAKAWMDVVDLRRQHGHKIGFCGNMDVITWAQGEKDEIKKMVLTKLNAAKGGGYIVQSDHSVPSNVSGGNYDYLVPLVREHGRYPLRLGEFDIPDIH